ncbi:predicted protein [Chaetomium globosum CBS 148.51]|uniref:Uncharacterized protein n=1 Tax=Chaetomium globosum (strain ATCC 6205 / CBS 148.51 / DSM 1962 / NBRC 6347 / NRRL 1970) TaxID=306901 RepID=Q2H2Q2_CHAGB|nr:uncharacterized protein CHGG_03944 [Chaetomium globosum CBS 148.51]EAQ87325.1 predicted protein [Chaetomium globosum CBS 148.51]
MTTTKTPPSPAAAALNDTSILPRRIASIALVVLLYTAATPFAPVSWLTGPVSLSGTYFLDRLVAGLVLFCAFYFQWAIASLRAAVVVSLPTGGSTARVLRNGRLEHDPASAGSVPLWVWRTADYWHFALAEVAVLLVAEFGGSETMRRLLVLGVILFLWVVGWAATPASLKRWAWEHIKVYLFVLVLDELRNIGYGALQGMAGGGQRRRRGRW